MDLKGTLTAAVILLVLGAASIVASLLGSVHGSTTIAISFVSMISGLILLLHWGMGPGGIATNNNGKKDAKRLSVGSSLAVLITFGVLWFYVAPLTTWLPLYMIAMLGLNPLYLGIGHLLGRPTYPKTFFQWNITVFGVTAVVYVALLFLFIFLISILLGGCGAYC